MSLGLASTKEMVLLLEIAFGIIAMTYRLQDGVLRHEFIGRILHRPTA
jgi:hypothetical protein